MTFVDRVLFFRDSSDIKKFYLDFDEPEEDNFSRIESWICTAIRRNVVELNLSVHLYLDTTFELPQSLFTCKTLEVLSLKSKFIANPPKSGCFPSLKVLDVLVHYPDLDNSSLGHIFSNCPVLEDLRIDGTLWGLYDGSDFKISAPELKRLTVVMYIDNFEDDEEYIFYINAPKLEVFNFPSGDSSVFSFEINAKSLFKANIHLSSCDRQVDGTNGLLEAISNVKQLSLSTRYLEGDVPAFDNLNHLELNLCGFSCWRYLTEFLKRSRNLECLVIKHSSCQHCGIEHEDFTPPEFVPVCMLSHLKTISIASFKGRQDDMRVAQYLLKYSEVLNKMIFTISAGLPRAEEEALYKEFLMFERGSKTCQVEIYN